MQSFPINLNRKILVSANIVIFILLCASFFLFDFNKILIFFLEDDAFYYFKIARNFAGTGSFTFDGFAGTNGFHPLWLLFLVPVFYFFKLSSVHIVQLILVIQVLLVLISLNLLVLKLKIFFRWVTMALVLNCFFLEFFYNFFSGMESALVFFLYTVFFCFSLKHQLGQTESSLSYFISGCLGGLIILSRLDQIFLILSFIVVVLSGSSYPFKERLVRSAKFLSGFLCLFAPYIILNLCFTGSAMPVSGRLKSSLPDINFNFSYAIDVMSVISIISLISSAWILFSICIKKNFLHKELSSLYLIFALTMISHFLYSVFFTRWGLFGWHFSIYAFFGILFTFPAFEMLINKLKKLKPKHYTLVITLIFFTLNLHLAVNARHEYKYVNSRTENHWHIQSYKAALWANENINPETVFAMSDAGVFSFFSGKRVINLDGLVNNQDYQEVLKNHRLLSYLKEHNVKYIVHHGVWDDEKIISGGYDTFTKFYPSYLYRGTGDSLLLKKENEVYRSPYFDAWHKAVFIIWKLE